MKRSNLFALPYENTADEQYGHHGHLFPRRAQDDHHCGRARTRCISLIL
jgi:hypothetical protein